MKIKKYPLPRNMVRIERTAGTISVRGAHGRFKGRKRTPGVGDGTPVRRVVRDVDVNHDGRIDYYGGTIAGRGTRKMVRGSRRAKAHVVQRRLE